MLLMTPHIHPLKRIRRLGLLPLAAQPPNHALASSICAKRDAAVRHRREPDIAVGFEAEIRAALVVNDGAGLAEESVVGKALEGERVAGGCLVVEEGRSW